jgi:hypothetical protein
VAAGALLSANANNGANAGFGYLNANNGANAGFGYLNANNRSSNANANIGFRFYRGFNL